MAIALILFCVFQVMPVAIATPVRSRTFLSPTPSTGDPVATTGLAADEEVKHDKRSLNLHPYGEIYLGTSNKIMEIFPNGTVWGTPALTPTYGVLSIRNACLNVSHKYTLHTNSSENWKVQSHGKVSIFGQKSQLYLCMNSSGRVYAKDTCDEDCNFVQAKKDSYTLYFSLKYRGISRTNTRPLKPNKKRKSSKRRNKKKKNGRTNPGPNKKWYLSLRKTGKPRRGWRTSENSKDIRFIERPVDPSFGSHDSGYSSLSTTQSSNVDKNSSISVTVDKNTKNTDSNSGKTSQRPNRRRHNKKRKILSRRNCDDPFARFRTDSGCDKNNGNQKKRHRNKETPESVGPFSNRRGLQSRDVFTDPSEQRGKFDLFLFPKSER